MSRIKFFHLKQDFKKVKFNKEQIKLLEKTDLLTIQEKLCILQFSTGTRFATTIPLSPSKINSESDILEPSKKDIKNFKNLIKKLGLNYVTYNLFQKDEKNNYKLYLLMYVCANKYTYNFLREYIGKISAFDDGVLFGYPTTAMQSFIKIRKRLDFVERTKHAGHGLYLIGPGACSLEYFEEENNYYNKIWEELKDYSKLLVKEGEKFSKKDRKQQIEYWHNHYKNNPNDK